MAEERNLKFIDDPNVNDMPAIERGLQNGESFVIADPHLCRKVEQEYALQWAAKFGAEVEWVFFENDPEQARANVTARNDGRAVDDTIVLQSREYHIREGSVVLPVWRPKK